MSISERSRQRRAKDRARRAFLRQFDDLGTIAIIVVLGTCGMGAAIGCALALVWGV